MIKLVKSLFSNKEVKDIDAQLAAMAMTQRS